MTGIYIHIPFCKSKCPYCDFYSFKPDETQKDSYLKAVLRCIKENKSQIKAPVDTVYFGGGTPSFFGGERIRAVIDCIKENYTLISPEITVECNPSSVSDEFFEIISKAGVNRISMGMQSAVDSERKALGRLSGKDEVGSAISLAKKNGINNISLDLMLGVPYQTMESLNESIDFLISSDIKHISAYMLKIEEGTPFYKMQNSLTLPDEDTVCEMYLHTVKRLSENGFEQYEISNFAKKGFESRHNLHYWRTEEYLGIGPSAHSFLNGKRFYFERDFNSFLINPAIIEDGDGGSEEEYIMLSLRLSEGFSKEKFKERFGRYPDTAIFQKAKELEKHNLLKIENETISLTPEGFLISNSIIGKLLE